MLKLNELIAFLEGLSPFSLQESWDNCGLNLGSNNAEYENIAIALELTLELAQELPPKSVVLTHHPLFFRPLKNFNPSLYPANIATLLLQKSCALVALHTNFDKTHLNPHFAKILGLSHTKEEGMALVADIAPVSLDHLATQVQERLNLPYVRLADAKTPIERVAVVCGAGCGVLHELKEAPKNLCLITGDIKHHDAMQALSVGVSLLEVPHYESEKFFVPLLKDLLEPYILQSQVKCVKLLDCKNPFMLKV
ncbi:Nif3-like dinuclear metal center hexameric protein [Helicobacter ailurogastricus]|uniref:GTP cyclohydrolase 1 type 2 homolog n=1 Tax=Helicobacter ailurogastricus TaxID=1578720 RepID=A0A0K2X3E0_9HELI|nr:Nif3-like dinuclear metal center hexameric protein [Helicobacter ailurogastricus]CRF41505.1 FIG137478: Hypothetical protein [Helicobacter ailurogastricus]CRF42973.1 FIG137478: Hypothetical protein [Helicobacter ailurogastricus]CRF43702.1 FIG137478: Hypothetical protein [Helicobacter ailurogastricus]